MNRLLFRLLAVIAATGLLVGQAQAVPSFARQTDMACAACHTVFPELNAFGRNFKLGGYTLSAIKQVEAKESATSGGLQITQIPPLSAMLQVSATRSDSQDPTTEIAFPDQLSFFYAGKISPLIGSFIQVTMDSTGNGFALDNTDIRFADRAGKVAYGVTLNNNPTVQDLWNSTPAWGYPWTGGADITSPLVAGGLAQSVAGLGAYADWGNGFYTELSLYRETNPFDAPSGSAPGQVRIRDAAPYYRLAWNKTFASGDYLMIGAFGIRSDLTQDGDSGGPADQYDDNAIDTQYEHRLANDDLISVHASYINEKQTLDLSGGGSPTLKSTRVDATYHWGNYATATLGYAANSSGNSAYEDTAYTGEIGYLPWQNTRFTLQYVAYSKKAGATDSASDNNTWLLQAWLMW